MNTHDYDALNDALLAAQDTLRDIPGSEPVVVEIFLDEVDDTDEYVRFHLGRLQVVRSSGDKIQVLPVTHAPIRLRLRIAELLPEIRSRIVERAAELSDRIGSATRAAQAFAGGAR